MATIVISGANQSGKTTLAKKLSPLRFDLDKLRHDHPLSYPSILKSFSTITPLVLDGVRSMGELSFLRGAFADLLHLHLHIDAAFDPDMEELRKAADYVVSR